MKRMNFFDWFALVLLVVGGLNWGLVGFFRVDLIAAIFGQLSVVSRVLYALIGISAAYMAVAPMRFMEECPDPGIRVHKSM